MLVVLDTNIVVSALLYDSPASLAHKAWIEGTLPLGHTIEIPGAPTSWIPADPDDDRFMEAAIHGKAEALCPATAISYPTVNDCLARSGPWRNCLEI